MYSSSDLALEVQPRFACVFCVYRVVGLLSLRFTVRIGIRASSGLMSVSECFLWRLSNMWRFFYDSFLTYDRIRRVSAKCRVFTLDGAFFVADGFFNTWVSQFDLKVHGHWWRSHRFSLYFVLFSLLLQAQATQAPPGMCYEILLLANYVFLQPGRMEGQTDRISSRRSYVWAPVDWVQTSSSSRFQSLAGQRKPVLGFRV